jgi:hypothetical protein
MIVRFTVSAASWQILIVDFVAAFLLILLYHEALFNLLRDALKHLPLC